MTADGHSRTFLGFMAEDVPLDQERFSRTLDCWHLLLSVSCGVRIACLQDKRQCRIDTFGSLADRFAE